MIKAVIFDFDETLCMNEEACFYLENEALAKMGRPPMSRDVHQKTWGMHLDEAMALRSPGVDIEKFKPVLFEIQSDFTIQGKMDQVPEENLEVLDELAVQGKHLMILTGRDERDVLHLMDPKHHLGSRISNFYYRENNQFHKPDPRTFKIIERDHQLKPSECVYVGDTLGDAEAAKQAGLYFVCSLEGRLKTKEDFNGYDVDSFINNLPELIGIINKLDSQNEV